jgi:hypothetical protein
MKKYQTKQCRPCVNISAAESRTRTGNAAFKQWSAINATKVLWHAARHRALKQDIPFSITPDDIIIPSMCPVLGVPLLKHEGKGGGDYSPSVDRFQPSLGYVRGNINVISKKANRIKNDGSVEEIKAVVRWMENHIKGSE